MSWSLPFFPLGLSAVLALSACPGDVDLVSIESELFANGCEAEPVFSVLSPQREQTFSGSLPVVIEVGNFSVVDKAGEPPQPCEGHMHVFIDNSLVTYASQPEFDLDLSELGPGPHDLRIELHENNHAAITDIEPIEVTFVVD